MLIRLSVSQARFAESIILNFNNGRYNDTLVVNRENTFCHDASFLPPKRFFDLIDESFYERLTSKIVTFSNPKLAAFVLGKYKNI